MNKRKTLTKIIATLGTAIALFPILATVLLSVAGSFAAGVFRFDYLMPAELFPAVLLGGALLVWAAWRARLHRGLIGGGFAAAVVLLFAGQGLAVVTGLDSGRTQPGGWQWAVVFASLAGYCLAVIAIGIGGILLLRDLFRAGNSASEPT